MSEKTKNDLKNAGKNAIQAGIAAAVIAFVNSIFTNNNK